MRAPRISRGRHWPHCAEIASDTVKEVAMTGSFLAFIGISILVIVTPGPDTAMTVRNTLLGGRGSGIFTALGVATGQAVWAFATSIGIVALLVAPSRSSTCSNMPAPPTSSSLARRP
jgi:hypothetical protein